MTGPGRLPHRYYLSRALEHGRMKSVAQDFAESRGASRVVGPVPPELQRIGRLFVQLQELRHLADYDVSTNVTRFQAVEAVRMATELTELWKGIRRTPAADLFLVAMLVRSRA
jgi:hypothetical protein